MKFLFVFGALLVSLAGGVGFAAWQLGYFDPPGASTTFLVEKGENLVGIARELEAAGIVKRERALRWYVNIFGAGKGLKRGEFALVGNMPVPELVRALTEGRPVEYKLTIPEGFNIFQVADLLAAQKFTSRDAFLAAVRAPELIQSIPTLGAGERRPASLEGYLYPDTYLIQRVQTAPEIAQAMVQQFREKYRGLEAEIQASPVMREFKFTPHELVTLASIVEKETGAAQERPLIASVFLNRLRKRMRLQTDPTVIYGMWSMIGSWDGNIRRKDLTTPSSYNTYQMDGLPTGPIANPSASAIRAVLRPAESEFLYFVSRGDGTHIFSKDYTAHARAVRETQLNPAAKAGKSWRDLPAEQRAK